MVRNEREAAWDRCRWCGGSGVIDPLVRRAFAYHETFRPTIAFDRSRAIAMRPVVRRLPTVAAVGAVSIAAGLILSWLSAGPSIVEPLGYGGALLLLIGVVPLLGAVVAGLLGVVLTIGGYHTWGAAPLLYSGGALALGLALVAGAIVILLLPVPVDPDDPYTLRALIDLDDPAPFIARFRDQLTRGVLDERQVLPLEPRRR